MADAQGYVFVSYPGADQDAVATLVRVLEGRGIPFLFDRDLGAGERRQEGLRDLLDGAAAVLVVWSPNSASSAWVIREASAAAASDRLVPLTLNSTQDIPEPFQDLMTLDLNGWDGNPGDPAWTRSSGRYVKPSQVMPDRIL